MRDEPSGGRLSTGVAGLDEVLHGGLLPRRSYLVRGAAGTGKTTLGLHFLAAGAAAGERTLYITLGESEARIRENAAALGFDLADVPILDLTPSPAYFAEGKTYDIFAPADVEREPTSRRIIEEVERRRPQRVFVDSLSQFRHLASDPLQFHKQTLSFFNYLTGREVTVLFASESGRTLPDEDLQFMSDGVVDLATASHRRTLRVVKFRGSGFQEGRHALRLAADGVRVYPRLLPERHAREAETEILPSGIAGLDDLLHGGVERGTATLLTGPSGVGKSTLAMHFVREAAKRGGHCVVYALEEPVSTLAGRCEALGVPVRKMIEDGSLTISPVEPHRYMPEEFVGLVRDEVERRKAVLVVIDSISGYRKFLRGDDLLTDLHMLCQYLRNMGVTVLLTNEVEQIAGGFRATEHGVTYLAGNILYLRYMERRTEAGAMEVRRCVGVLKKRLSDFGKEVRELDFADGRVSVGGPVLGLNGVLSAMPVAGDAV